MMKLWAKSIFATVAASILVFTFPMTLRAIPPSASSSVAPVQDAASAQAADSNTTANAAKPTSGGNQQGSATPPTNSTDPTANLCTYPKPDAASSSPASKGTGAGTPTAGQNAGGQVNNVYTVGQPAAGKQKAPGGINTDQTPKVAPTSFLILYLNDSGSGNTNAAEIGPLLKTVSSRVLDAHAISPTEIEVILDATASQSPAKGTAKSPTLAEVEAELKKFAHAMARPDPRVFAIALPAGTGKACSVAGALIKAVPEIASITAVDDSRILVTERTDPNQPASGLVDLFGPDHARAVHSFMLWLNRQPNTAGVQLAYVPEILSVLERWQPSTQASVEAKEIDRLRSEIIRSNDDDPKFEQEQQLLARLRAADEPLETRVRRLVSQIAPPLTAAAPSVDTIVQRLFYIHDPVSVAALIKKAYPGLEAQALPPNKVVLSQPRDEFGVNQNDGERSALASARRTIAQLDQPHEQVSVDAWALQIATRDKDKLHKINPQLEDLIGLYNHAIQSALEPGWAYLSAKIADPNNLDPLLKGYLTSSTRVNAEGAVNLHSSDLTPTAGPGYGLGYQSLYYPLTHNLLDMLVTLASLKSPLEPAREMFQTMYAAPHCCESDPAAALRLKLVNPQDQPDDECDQAKCVSIDSRKPIPPAPPEACRERDRAGYPKIVKDYQDETRREPPRLMLACVRDALIGPGGLFAKSNGEVSTGSIGQFRAALADFLFHYKLTVEYPEEFHAYQEPMAADNLDAAFEPIVNAFNQDISVLQEQLQAEVQATLKKQGGLQYGYGGLVTLSVLGDEAGKVSTATQNYFDATPPATLNDLLANLQTEGAAVAKSPLATLVTSLAPAKAVELLTVLGQTLAPKTTTAHLGRGLDMDVTAHPLSGGFGAELDLSVKSTENGAALIPAGGKSSDDLNSRVSQHTVDTHVRIDSLQLFKVSTLSSVLARGQSPWKPFDPIEIPALSLVLKVPRKPQEVYTQSLIVVDAMVVPTAADLGYGVPLVEDQMQIGTNKFRRLHSLKDFPNQIGERILQYHEKIVNCLNREYVGDGYQIHTKDPGKSVGATDIGPCSYDNLRLAEINNFESVQ